jgi:nucleoid-associated protein YgaU
VTATLIASVPSQPGASRTQGGPVRWHTVASGDTLSKISLAYYGTPARWADILVANRDILGDDNNLVVGRTLRIP